MPKSVPCPVCKSSVKVPRDAEPGITLTCSDCEERFTPPHLKPKGYDPEEEDGYDLNERDDDEDESIEKVEKRRKTKAIRSAGRQYHAQVTAKKNRGGIRPLDIALLIAAIGAAFGTTLGFIAAKKAPTTGVMILIIVAFCGLLGIFAYRHLMRRK